MLGLTLGLLLRRRLDLSRGCRRSIRLVGHELELLLLRRLLEVRRGLVCATIIGIHAVGLSLDQRCQLETFLQVLLDQARILINRFL